MAEDAAPAPSSSRGRADGEDADPGDELVAQTTRDDPDRVDIKELLEVPVPAGNPADVEDAALVAEAETVASGWMLDFFCLSLCRAFRDGRSEDFRRTRDSAEAVIHGFSSLTTYQLKTVYICQFLARIAAGKALDAQFETDERITPLESALMIWASIEKEHDKLHEEIETLIKIQAIGVCMENGNFKEAEEVFERIFGDPNSFMPLKRKLLMVISQKEPFHSIFQHFSYNHLMEKVKIYVNCVLTEKSSSFLMKAATKVVESKKNRAIDSHNEPNGNNAEMENEINLHMGKRSHKDLLAKLKQRSHEEGFSKNKETLPSGRKVENRTTRATTPVLENQLGNPEKNRNRKRKAWIWEEDKNLRYGVKKYGEGNWSKILSHYKFNNRTSVMLKDRWRTMKKLKLVSVDNEC
ncbi:telomeric repeat-binding factor 1 isoform X2 [Sorex araneus]|uniref:telomeric repeat-binding factor 1 isoform X2 n=1 Tax=Sorex araneus TaxID=42254 RepID=UPI002433EA4E|nr:telomeric repeat-binding factor 1 isoform X2 [Sorex araneus]